MVQNIRYNNFQHHRILSCFRETNNYSLLKFRYLKNGQQQRTQVFNNISQQKWIGNAKNQTCDLQRIVKEVFLDYKQLAHSLFRRHYQYWLQHLNKQASIFYASWAIVNLIYMIGSLYQRKVVILIDNYDDFIFTENFRRSSELKRKQYINQMYSFMFKCTQSAFLHRAIIFGVCNIAPLTTSFKVSSLYNYQSKFKTCLGFTENEVKLLIEQTFNNLPQEDKAEIWNQISQNIRGYNRMDMPQARLFSNSRVIQYLQKYAQNLTFKFFNSQQNNLRYLSSILQTQQAQFFFCTEFLIQLLQGQKIKPTGQYYKKPTQEARYICQGFAYTNLAQFVYQLIHMGYLKINRNILEIANAQAKLGLQAIINNWIERLFFAKLQRFTKPNNINSSTQNWKYFHEPIAIMFAGLLGRFIQCGESMLRYLSYVAVDKYFPATALSKCDLFTQGNSLSFIDTFQQQKMLIFHRYFAVRTFGQKCKDIHCFQRGFRELFLQQDLMNTIAEVQKNPEHKNCKQMLLRSNKSTKIVNQNVYISIEGAKNILSELENRAFRENVCKRRILDQLIQSNNAKSWTDFLIIYAYKESEVELEERSYLYII